MFTPRIQSVLGIVAVQGGIVRCEGVQCTRTTIGFNGVQFWRLLSMVGIVVPMVRFGSPSAQKLQAPAGDGVSFRFDRWASSMLLVYSVRCVVYALVLIAVQ